MKYFKRNWNETRGDQYDSWGKSVWLFETDNNGEVLRQTGGIDPKMIFKYKIGNFAKFFLKTE